MFNLKNDFVLQDVLAKLHIDCHQGSNSTDPIIFCAMGSWSEAYEAPVLAFCKTTEAADRLFSGGALHPDARVLIPKNSVFPDGIGSTQGLHIDNPKAVFFRVLDYLISIDELSLANNTSHGSADIQQSAIIEQRVAYGERVYIGHHAVIGSSGYGFVDLPNGSRLRIPHLAGVVIGSDVEIGDNTTVNSGILQPTVIADGVKIDSNVLIGHGSYLGKNSLVVGGAVICGSVSLGEDCWVGPNTVIANGVTVGDRAHLGLGCVVSKDVPSDSRWIGNPPRRVA